MKHPFSFVVISVVSVVVLVVGGFVFVRSGMFHLPNDLVSGNVTDGDVVDVDSGTSGQDTTVISSDSGNVTISSPQPGETLGLPLVLRGTARVFENTFNYRLLDDDGSVLIEGHAMTTADDAGVFGDYVVTTTYPEPKGVVGTVQVFDYSAKDGSIIDLASVPIVFSTDETMTVQTYWTTIDSGTDCSSVTASPHRVARSVATAYAALSELLKGPDDTEASLGFTTSIPDFVAIRSISVQDGIAKVELSKSIEVGGSCRVQSIRAQIEATLLQFPTVSSVVITSEGKTAEETLQP